MKVRPELTETFRGEVMGPKNGKNAFFQRAYFWHFLYKKEEEKKWLILKKKENSFQTRKKILALLASWSFHQKPTAKRRKFSIEKELSITKT